MPERHTVQQATLEHEGSKGRSRQTLQSRVQNALRWRSWGGESDAAASNALHSTSAPGSRPSSGPGRHRAGRSAGSDVELSALPSTTTSSISSDMAVLSSPAATVGSGEQLARSTFGSNKSSTSSAAGAGPPIDAGSSSAGAASSSTAAAQHPQQQHGHQQQSTAAIGVPGAADDACSIVTQAGSTAHSFTSLYSMLADQGEAGSEAAGPAAAAGIAGSSIGHTGGAMSPFRGSDAGGDGATSVSTLPLISEAAYDDEQQLMQEVDELAGGEGVSGRVSGFDEVEEGQGEDGLGAQRHAAQQGALVMSGISGRPRVSSSHGSITSAASDASLSAPGSSASGPVGASAAAVGTRIPSPAGASSSSFGRPGHGSQRSSGSRHGLHQQQQQGLGESRHSTDLPLPFGMRKRPDNDEACSYATQAGSVHSVSSILSSAFAESAPQQRTSGSGAAAAAGQQLLIHPLSEPADELACFEEEDGGLTAPGRSASVADGSINVHHHSMSSPGSSSGQQREQLGNSWDMEQQQWQQQPQGGASAALAGAHGVLERKGSLKGALRSVVAWGSGLGQRLQREKHPGHKQQQGAARPGASSSSRSEAPPAGPLGGQQRPAAAATGSGQELASI